MGNPGDCQQKIVACREWGKCTFLSFVNVEVAVRDYAGSLQGFYCNNANGGLRET